MLDRRPRLAYLDGLRGFAALIVVLHHLALGYAPVFMATAPGNSGVGASPLLFLVDGHLAVIVFFLLSGIALSASIDNGRDRPERPGFCGLTVKRWTRLSLPILTLAVPAWFLTGPDTPRAAATLSHSRWLAGLFPADYHPSLFQNIYEGLWGAVAGFSTPAHNPNLWTIRVEFPGSLMVFALCLLVPGGRARQIVCLAIFIGCLFPAGWIFWFCGLFAIGVILGDVIKTLPAKMGPIRERVGVLLIVAALIAPWLDLFDATAGWRPEVQAWMNTLPVLENLSQWFIRGTMIVLGVILWVPAQRFFETKPLQLLGKASFPLYLMHGLLLWGPGAHLYLFLHPYLGAGLSAWGVAVFVLGVGLPASLLFHHWVEKPSVRLAGRLGLATDRLIRRRTRKEMNAEAA